MEEIIKIKTECGVELSDTELAVRWWKRLSLDEKKRFVSEHLSENYDISEMNYSDIYWLWKKKQTL